MKALTELNVADLLKECNTSFEDTWDMINKSLATLKKRLIEEALEAERTELVCCHHHGRSILRKDSRNGYWKRFLLLKDGRLELKVPRVRSGGYASQVVPRYMQRIPEVDHALQKVFLFGVSTRRCGEALSPLLGDSVSAQTISTIAKSLDQEVKAFHARPLCAHYIYLFLDGIILKVRTGFGSQKKAILVAYGITTEGKRELIDFTVVKHESEHAWEGFLLNLLMRGLTGTHLHLIITDGNQGLANAVDLTYPGIQRQRCWAHKMRNVATYLTKQDRDECIREARNIYDANSRKEAIEAYFGWAKEWRSRRPKAVACMEKDLEELLAFYGTPKPLWKKLRTTNAIERAFREVRRRTRPMSCFNNTQSIERIVYAVLSHLNDQWWKKPLKEFTQSA
jgi:transposase-like protein